MNELNYWDMLWATLGWACVVVFVILGVGYGSRGQHKGDRDGD